MSQYASSNSGNENSVIKDDCTSDHDLPHSIEMEDEPLKEMHDSDQYEKTEAVNELTPSKDDCASDNDTPHSIEMEDEPPEEMQESDEDEQIEAIDELMPLIGLEAVKSRFLDIKAKVEVAGLQNRRIDEPFNAIFMGNPGTGKTTVLHLYNRFLRDIGVVQGETISTTGPRLAFEGIPFVEQQLRKLAHRDGGTFIVDDADCIANDSTLYAAMMDFLFNEMKSLVGVVVFIFAGGNHLLQKFVEHDPGVHNHFPYCFQFSGFTERELLQVLKLSILEKYYNFITVEGGVSGRFVEVLIRRLAGGRGREGFGNIRALSNAWSSVMENQARRIELEHASKLSPDYKFLTKEDIIGPEPSLAVRDSEAWKELMALTGLCSVKDSIRVFVDRMQVNYNRELQGMMPVEVSLNRVFMGSPGTGKTTVAKLYGRILADIGLLSSREVVVKNPSDFIGQYIGESENKTRAVLKASEGKVLVIDEAYMLDPAKDGMCESYRKGIVDTIVGEVQSVPGEDRCVILLGYKEEMEEMFQNSNPGLERRFQLDHAFHFEDFDDEQLEEILESKLLQQGLKATEKAKTVALEVLARARSRPGFGNAGEVENLIGRAKARHQKRQNGDEAGNHSCDIVFEPRDFDPDFDPDKRSCRRLFTDVIGCEDLVQKLEGYHKVSVNVRARGADPRDQIPFNFIFKGPPGTGKTTTARKMGQVFYDMGILSSADVVECSASDLLGQYIGWSGPKTRKLLTRGLGKVLFIDEAYLLESNGYGYAHEAVGELVDCLTKPKFKAKMIVILAGYTNEMNKLLRANPGLSSRFPEEVVFHSLAPCQSIKLLLQKLGKAEISLQQGDTLKKESSRKAHDLFRSLSTLPSWGNGRDIETLSKSIIGHVLRTADPETSPPLTVSDKGILIEMRNMLQ